MMIRRKSPNEIPAGLTLALSDFVLGIRRWPYEIEAIRKQGVRYDAFLQFDLDRAPETEIEALRTLYRAALDARACEQQVDWPRVARDVEAAEQERQQISRTWFAGKEETS